MRATRDGHIGREGFMELDPRRQRSGMSAPQGHGIRFLVESALRSIASERVTNWPTTRAQWVERLCEALMSTSETSHQSVIAELISIGVSSQDIYQIFVPEAARHLGKLWLHDEASFVDVSIGAARLQALLREAEGKGHAKGVDTSIPLGQSVLIVIPEFEQHSLGAFVAADQFRRHGLWVHMAIALNPDELVNLVATGRFSMIGVTAASRKTVEKLAGLVEYIRSRTETCPPVVVGGRAVDEIADVARRTGADFAVKSVREAVERCGLATVAETLSSDIAL
ncbi:cobalamin B12-binding domain-containing protein [Roseovarius litoreus]|nr:cobalamin-dependent protein [Roseovarius litoreus]